MYLQSVYYEYYPRSPPHPLVLTRSPRDDTFPGGRPTGGRRYLLITIQQQCYKITPCHWDGYLRRRTRNKNDIEVQRA